MLQLQHKLELFSSSYDKLWIIAVDYILLWKKLLWFGFFFFLSLSYLWIIQLL